MMDMGIGGVLGAGASLASGIMAAEAADRAANMNWSINMLNYSQREREREEANALGRQLRAEQKLGFQDIRGTTTKFVPGKGWVVTGAPALLELMKLQDEEQKKTLTEDIPLRRASLKRNYQRSLAEEGLADTFRRQLQNTAAPRSDDAYAGDLYNAMSTGIREGELASGKRAFTQAARTGQNSNFAKIAEGLQRASTSAYGQAALQAKLMSRGTGAKEVAERRGGLANLYNLFATRAQQLPDTNYRPQAIDTKGEMSLASGAAAQGNAAGMQAAMMKGGTLDYIQPNYGWANAVGGAGSALASAFRAQEAKNAYGQQQQGGVSGFGGSGGSYRGDDMYIGSEGT